MNIFKFLSKSGKVALSGLQMAGLTAVVGAAGFGAWQYLSGPADDNNAFNPAQYNSEVVYVSNANTGGYNGVPSGAGSGPSMQVSAQTLKRLDRQAQAERVAREMEDERFYTSGDGGAAAYQMGGTEGLGMGANYVDNPNSDSSPMGVMQQSMAGVQNMITKAQQQVTGTASGQNPAGESIPPSLDNATPSWSRGGSGNGGTGGSSFAIQNSGKNGRGRRGGNAATGGGMDAQSALSSAQAQAAGMLEGARIRGHSSFGSMETLRADRDATVQGGGRGRGGKSDLEFIQKRSADAAANRNRSDNEGSRAFLASTQISGGMRITAENVTTGQGQHSRDFDTDTEVNLRSIRTWGSTRMSEEELRDSDRSSVQKWFWIAIGVSVVAMLAIPYLKNITVFGVNLGLVMMLAAIAFCINGFVRALNYGNQWGFDGFSITSMIVTALMVVGVGCSFFLSNAFQKFYTWILKKLGISGAGSGAASGGGEGLEMVEQVLNKFTVFK